MCNGGYSGPEIPLTQYSDADLASVQLPSRREVAGGYVYVYPDGETVIDQAQYDAMVSEYGAAQAELQRRSQTRIELDRLAAESTAEAARQVEELQRLQAASAQAQIDQQNTAAQLQQEAAQQQQQIEQSRLAVQAMTASTQVLGSMPSAQGPTAAVAAPKPDSRGVPTTTSSLRIGSTSQPVGTGLNIGV